MARDNCAGVNSARKGLRSCKLMSVCVLLIFCDKTNAFSDYEHSEEVLSHSRFQKAQETATDEIRCNCNLPECVTTGYMCKSVGGGCFSEVIDHQRPSSSHVYNNRHGCLQRNQRDTCRSMQNTKLSCCFKDMCNQIGHERQFLFNTSNVADFTNTDGPSSDFSDHNMAASAPGYNSNEVWFKAAIIAVPICGIVILILLIFLAVKILRTDTLHSTNKLGIPYTHGSDRKSNRDHFEHQSPHNFKKIPLLIHPPHISEPVRTHSDELQKLANLPLLVQNEISYDRKNEANAKLNSAQNEFNYSSKDTLLGLQKPLNSCNNVYRNVNLSFNTTPTTTDASLNDKLYEKPVLNAVITWGTPSQSSSHV